MEQILINIVEKEDGLHLVKSRLVEEELESKLIQNIDETELNIVNQLEKVQELELAKKAIEVYKASLEDAEETDEEQEIE